MKYIASTTVLAFLLFLGAPTSARAQEIIHIPGPPARPQFLSPTIVASGPNGPKDATRIKIDTDTGYAGALGMLYMTDSDAVMKLPQALQEIDDNKEWAGVIALGEKKGSASVNVTSIVKNAGKITITYAVTPAAAGDTTVTHPFVFFKFPKQDGITTANISYVDASASAQNLPVTVVLSGTKGPDFATKAMIDTDTGYAGSLGGLFMNDKDEVMNLPQALQEIDDNKENAVEITLGKKTGVSSVAVQSVTTDGSTLTINYVITPPAAGDTTPSSPFTFVKFPRPTGIPTSNWHFNDVSPAPGAGAPAATSTGGSTGTTSTTGSGSGYGAATGGAKAPDPVKTRGIGNALPGADDK